MQIALSHNKKIIYILADSPSPDDHTHLVLYTSATAEVFDRTVPTNYLLNRIL